MAPVVTQHFTMNKTTFMFHDFEEGFLVQMGVFLPKLARGGFPHSRASFSHDITSSSAKNSLLLNRTIDVSSVSYSSPPREERQTGETEREIDRRGETERRDRQERLRGETDRRDIVSVCV